MICSKSSWIEYPKDTFNLVFTYDSTGFVQDRTRTESRLIQALHSYPEVVLFYPDLKAMPEYKHILACSPDSFEEKRIHQVESPGEYAFTIKITDEINNDSASQRMAFPVL